MISQVDFEFLITEVVRDEFGPSLPAFEEVSTETVENIFNGKASEILASKNDEDSSAALQFGDAAAAVAAIVPVLNLIKLAAETYVSLQKCWTKEMKPSPDAMQKELANALAHHVGKVKAQKVAETIVQKLVVKGM